MGPRRTSSLAARAAAAVPPPLKKRWGGLQLGGLRLADRQPIDN